MADTIRIQVITEESTPYGTFRDAIYYSSMADYEAKVADGSHEAEKAQRVANYLNVIQNPPAPIEPSKEVLEEHKAQLEAQVAELSSQIAVARPKAVIDAEKAVLVDKGLVAEEIQ